MTCAWGPWGVRPPCARWHPSRLPQQSQSWVLREAEADGPPQAGGRGAGVGRGWRRSGWWGDSRSSIPCRGSNRTPEGRALPGVVPCMGRAMQLGTAQGCAFRAAPG